MISALNTSFTDLPGKWYLPAAFLVALPFSGALLNLEVFIYPATAAYLGFGITSGHRK